MRGLVLRRYGPILLAAVTVAVILAGGLFDAPSRRLGLPVLLLVAGVVAGTRARPLAPVESLIGAWVVWSAGVAVWTHLDPFWAHDAIATWCLALLIWFGVRGSDPATARRAVYVTTAGAAAVAAWTVGEALAAGSLRHGGPLENSNLTAAVLIPVGLVAGAAALTGRRRPWAAALAGVCLAGVVATGSRAGLIAVVAGAWWLLPAGRWRRRGTAALLALAIAAVLVRFIQSPDPLAWHRLEIWSSVVHTWADRPLTGCGPGGLDEAVLPHRPHHPELVSQWQMVPTYAESTVLAVAVQTGAVGLALILVAAFVWWREPRENDASASLARGRQAAAVGVASLMVFHDVLTADPVLWWWALVIGLLDALHRPSLPATVPAPRPGPVRAAAVTAIAWVVVAGGIQTAMARAAWEGRGGDDGQVAASVRRLNQWYDAPLRHRVARLLDRTPWTRDDAAAALAAATEAVRIHPGSASNWAALGRVRLRAALEAGGGAASLAAAEAALRHATQLDPWEVWTWLEWARLERARGRIERARELVDRALEVETNAIAGWLFAARLALDAGDPEAARRALERADTLLDHPRPEWLSPSDRRLLEAPHDQLEQLNEALR